MSIKKPINDETPESMKLVYRRCRPAYDWEIPEPYIDELIRELFRSGCEFSEEKEEDIRRTLEEILGNSCKAIDHLNDDNLTIELNAFWDGNRLIVRVTDEGPGFDYRKEVTARQQDDRGLTREKVINLLDYPEMASVGGTGMFCLLTMTQGFQFNDKGNEVTVYFDLSA